MRRREFDDLHAFVVVAREGTFTRAAKHLGVSQSALSHTISALEKRLDIRLLRRTTRSVAPTDAGDRLLRTVRPRFEEIEAELQALSEYRDKPAGTVRITAGDHATDTLLWPKLAPVLAEYPELRVEIGVEYGLIDIVQQRYDAGVRFGEQVEKDMIAVRIGPDMRMAVVASPAYFAERSVPVEPQELVDHRCINMRLPTYGGLYAWEFEKGDRELEVQVDGQLVFHGVNQVLAGALSGFGMAYLPEDMVQRPIEEGRLVRVLEDWCPPFPGYYLYYPSRHHTSPAFNLVLDALRHWR